MRTPAVPFKLKFLLILVSFGLIASCAAITQDKWDTSFGKAQPRSRAVNQISGDVPDYWTQVKPVLEARCVSCHACYDAPCQLKASAIEGLERGGHKDKVYTPSRLASAEPTRLFEDAQTISQWREKGFHPVLNERSDSPEVTRKVDLIYRFLQLKEDHPLPPQTSLLPASMPIGLGRDHECPTPAEFEQFAKTNPQWGMPYALPGLDGDEQAVLKTWLEAGAPYTPRAPLPEAYLSQISIWESFLNGKTLKSHLVSRYLYEHLFLTHLYFPEVSNDTFFKLIRSATPPGEPPVIINTRRPFDDPQVKRVYYRLVPELETIVDKTHNPYKLDSERMSRFTELFFTPEYEVTTQPGYQLPDTANPFVTFDQLPMSARYKFLLDDAQSGIMNFIKGSVCRGQVAVNVVRDHFWVFFLDPDSELSATISDVLPNAKYELALANSSGDSEFMPIAHWNHYAKAEQQSRAARDEFMLQYFAEHDLTLDLVWDGDGINANAALTVFRHNDSATVEQGLLGDRPQTAWLVDYTLFERIHYLLVAGYDVYGSVGHQLISRLHMDFLRMQGETNFLNFLPADTREQTRAHWYRSAPAETVGYLSNPKFDALIGSSIRYKTEDPLTELMAMMTERVAPTLPKTRSLSQIKSARTRAALQRLAQFNGPATQFLSELTVIRVQGDTDEIVTLTRNNAHLNMTSIFNERKRLLPAENTVSVLNGVLGSYPNTFISVEENQIDQFVDQVLALKTPEHYHALLDEFGVRRTHPDFWKFSDIVHSSMRRENPTFYGILDYNRLENR